MRVVIGSIALAASSFVQVAATQPGSQGVTGIFSTFRVSERSGDIVGMELMLLGGADGLYAVVQGSEGAPGTPVVVRVAVRGDTIEFEVPVSCPCGMLDGTYRGQVDADGIALEGPGNRPVRRIPRTDSFWQSW